MPLEELNDYDVDFKRYDKFLKKFNFAEAFKGKNPEMTRKINEIDIKLVEFLREKDPTFFQEEAKKLELNQIDTSFSGSESDIFGEEAKHSVLMDKIKKIQIETDQADEYLNHYVNQSLTKVETRIEEMDKKASRRPSIMKEGSLSPTLFNKNMNKVRFDENRFTLELKNTYTSPRQQKAVVLSESDFIINNKAKMLETELEELEHEEKLLEDHLNSLKEEKVDLTSDKQEIRKKRRTSSVLKNKFEKMIKKRNTVIENGIDKNVVVNQNFSLQKDNISKNELTSLIYINQEKILNLNKTIDGIKKDIQGVYDDNIFLEIMRNKKEDITTNRTIDIDTNLNTYYYNKNLIFGKERSRLKTENDRLEAYYQNLKKKAYLVL